MSVTIPAGYREVTDYTPREGKFWALNVRGQLHEAVCDRDVPEMWLIDGCFWSEEHVRAAFILLEKIPDDELTKPRAVVLWTPRQIVERYDVSEAEALEFLEDNEEQLTMNMIIAGWDYLAPRAEERGWVEVDG